VVYNFPAPFQLLNLGLKVSHEDCQILLDAWLFKLTLEPCCLQDYKAVLKASKANGVRGGAFFDALHLHIARRLESQIIYTANLSDFQSIWRGDKQQIQNPC